MIEMIDNGTIANTNNLVALGTEAPIDVGIFAYGRLDILFVETIDREDGTARKRHIASSEMTRRAQLLIETDRHKNSLVGITTTTIKQSPPATRIVDISP